MLCQNSPANWRNEEIKYREWLTEGGDREKLEVHWEKPGTDQVRFIESVTMVTDRELKLPLSVKQARVTPLSLVSVTSLCETENSEFPSFQA